MPNTIEDEAIRELHERATRGELNGRGDIPRKRRPPGQLVDEELHVSGPGPVNARVRASDAAMRESSEHLAAPEMKELLLQIVEVLGELIPQSEARFIPGSIVGKILVKIDGQEASFFFLPHEDIRQVFFSGGTGIVKLRRSKAQCLPHPLRPSPGIRGDSSL
jgi:hypothetical protein